MMLEATLNCCAAVAVEVVHFLCELVQQEGADPQDLDPEVVGVLAGRHVHLQMLVRLEAQVWTGNWTTRNIQYWSSITTLCKMSGVKVLNDFSTFMENTPE